MGGIVTAVARSATHALSKPKAESIRLVAGLGVEGDAHLGVTVKHRSRVARDPSQPISVRSTSSGASCMTSWPPLASPYRPGRRART